MSASDDPDDEEQSDDVVRRFVQEEIKGIYFFGLKKCAADDIRQGWPKLYDYLLNNYGDFLKSCKFFTKTVDKLAVPVPYILLPDDRMTVLTWNKKDKRPEFSQSEDLARAIQRLK